VSVDYQTRQGMICRRVTGRHGRPEIEVEHVKGGDEEPLKLQIEAFLHAIATGSPPPVPGEDGVAALELAHQVLEAIGACVRRHTEKG